MPLYPSALKLVDILSLTKARINSLVNSPRTVGLLFLGCGLSVTFLSIWAVGGNALRWAKEENRTALEAAQEAISTKLQVEVAHLAALEGLYDASKEVEESEFASFINAIFEGSNGLRGRNGLGFISNNLNDQQLALFGDLEPRSGEVSIKYIHPLNWRNRYLKQLNVFELGNILKFMSESALSNRFLVSGAVALGGAEDSSPVFSKLRQKTRFLIHPIYKKEFINTLSRIPNSEHTSVDGWVFSNFDLAEFLSQALFTLEIKRVGELCVQENSITVYGSCNPDQSGAFGSSSLVSRKNMDFGGRNLSLSLTHSNASVTGSGIFAVNFNRLSLYTAFLGIFASFGGAYAVTFFSNSHVKTKRALSDAQAVLDEQSLAATVFEASSTGIIVCDSSRAIIRANAAFLRLTGFNIIELKGKNPSLLSSGRHSDSFFEDMYLRLDSTGFWSGNMWNKTKNNELALHAISINVVLSEGDDSRPLYYVANYQDITEQDRVGREALHRATHDPLTGFLNKKALIEDLKRHILLSKRHGSKLALFFLDLNSFKPINDTYGHEVGDLVLKHVADRLKTLFRESDLMARAGGDEFIIAALNIVGSSDVNVLADRIKEVIGEPIDGLVGDSGDASSLATDVPLRVGVSVGVAIFPDHGETADELIEFADQKMYVDKRRSSNL